MIGKFVALVGLTGRHKTGCFGKKWLVLHVPSSCIGKQFTAYYYIVKGSEDNL